MIQHLPRPVALVHYSFMDQKILCPPAEEVPAFQINNSNSPSRLRPSGKWHGTPLMDQKILCPQAEEVPTFRPRAMVHQLLFKAQAKRHGTSLLCPSFQTNGNGTSTALRVRTKNPLSANVGSNLVVSEFRYWGRWGCCPPGAQRSSARPQCMWAPIGFGVQCLPNRPGGRGCAVSACWPVSCQNLPPQPRSWQCEQ